MAEFRRARGACSMSNLLNRPVTAVILAIVIVAVVLLESTGVPWAPFFYLTAILTVAIPLAARTRFADRPRKTGRRLWLAIAAALTGLLVFDVALNGPVLDALHTGTGIMPLSLALMALLKKAAAAQGLSIDNATMIYAAFYVLWAPVAEEMFYRGYLRQALAPAIGEGATAITTSALFAARHVPHLMYLSPVPWPTIVIWSGTIFICGLILYWLVRRTGALWPAIVVHFVDNAIGLAL
jgi:membrane protease YdiL (CAAX protease family)